MKHPRAVLRVGAALTALLLSSCAAGAPSTLNPRGPAAARVAWLWWVMFGISVAVVAAIAGLLILAVARRGKSDPETEPRWALRMVLVGGVVFPAVVLVTLWVLTLIGMRALSQPAGTAAMRIEVIGHRWWWEVRYPDHGIVSANEVHVPTGERVSILLRSVDVQHSFWVPELAPKTDLYPGQTNEMWLEANHDGVFRGQCAEFCGLQHANMVFHVVAHAPAEFEAWIRRQAATAAEPTEDPVRRGLQLFLDNACVSCHTIRGTPADGRIGPDLTHFGSRISIGAGAAPNSPEQVRSWIANSQTIKPGNLMPPMPLEPEEIDALATYLQSLK